MSRAWLGFLFTVYLFAGHTLALNQAVVDYISQNLQVRYNVIDNLKANGRTYEFEIILRNTGNRAISKDESWAVHFCHIKLPQPEEFLINKGTYLRKEGVDLKSSGLHLSHVSGCLFKLVPTSTFKTLGPQKELRIELKGREWSVARSDVMQNWYVTGDKGTVARTIASTAKKDLSFVGDFLRKEQWKRVSWDVYDPYTAEMRYALYNASDMGSAPVRIVPSILRHDLDDDKRLNLMTGLWAITYKSQLEKKYAYILAEKLGISIAPVGYSPKRRHISVKIDRTLKNIPSCLKNAETYVIKIDPSSEKIEITGASAAGLFYGVQTMSSLASRRGGAPSGTIEDCPRFAHRGMMVDVARNFHGKSSIFKLLDTMAMYKMNVFHFHLTDDEGWRLYIPGIPELTKVGAHRCHDPSADRCIMPQLGSGPTTTTSGSGYYTVQDYKEILKYAADRHIEVIPEFDMPGHAHAAINAMLSRYRRLRNTDLQQAKKFLLTDLNDTSQYVSVQMFTDNAINPCLASTFTFIEHVLTEVIKMHKDIQPLKTFHFGGDEVPKTAWVNSTLCKPMMTGGDKKNVKKHFVMEVSKIAKKHGLRLQAWEDGMMHDAGKAGPFNINELATHDVRVNTWNNIWHIGTGSRSHIFANAGYKAILSFATNLYFDHPTEPDPESPGFYWASRLVDLERAFRLMPDSIYENIDINLMGMPITKAEICSKHSCPSLQRKENIIGIQGQLWSEIIRTPDRFQEMMFPRLLGLAERAWHKAPWENILSDKSKRDKERQKDWEEFVNLIGYQELGRLDHSGIKYQVRPPGAKMTGNHLDVRTEFPGLPVRLSTDGGATWRNYKNRVSLKPGETVTLVARSVNNLRESRAAKLKVAN